MYRVLDVCRHIIKYSNDRRYGISNLKLQKLLYFIQAYFLIVRDEPCFIEQIEAWDLGPVVPEAYHAYKQFGSNDIPFLDSFVRFDEKNPWNPDYVQYIDSVITEDDKAIINLVIDKFADYTATDLVALTHKQLPWKQAYVPGENRIIELKEIKAYFAA